MKKWTRALYQPGIPLGQDGRRVTASRDHIELSKAAAKEGMVLLKNDGAALPINRWTKVALFGKATFDYVKGGGGSGDVTVPYARNLYDGFHELNQKTVFEPLADFYRSYVEEQYRQGVLPGQVTEPAVPAKLLEEAGEFTDTAIISICRFSGEGADRTEADFYLTEEETAMVDAVKMKFDRVIAVLNVGGVISTEWFRTEPRIQAALLVWQGGIEGGLAAAELLCGIGKPSGRLADTFAKDITDYPSTASFGESDDYVEYTEDIYVGYRYFETIPGAEKKVSYPFGYGLSYTTFEIQCTEIDITFEGSPDFRVQVTNTGKRSGTEVVQLYVRTPAEKTDRPARQLVAFYKTKELSPGESCEFQMSMVLKQLAFYDETGVVKKSAWVLGAGDYHFYVGSNVRDAKEILFTDDIFLERFSFYIGKDSWMIYDGILNLATDVVVEQCTERMAPEHPFRRLKSDGSYGFGAISGGQNSDFGVGYNSDDSSTFREQNGKEGQFSNCEKPAREKTASDNSQYRAEICADGAAKKTAVSLKPLTWEEMECVLPATRAVPARCFLLKEAPRPQLIDVWRTENEYGERWSPESAEGRKLSTGERIRGEEDGVPFCCEPLALPQFVKKLPDPELASLLGGQPNTGVANTCGIGNLPRYGVPNIMTADGPAGLRIEKQCGVTTTAWPCATMLACTWDPDIVREVGEAAAEEVKENNIGIWLAPAVNIHRNPLCGRNFEYYSEDPLLAGYIGAAMVQGVQSRNIAATVKHFALNNKEQNRKESDSRASERAIREIYLRVFEIIVKAAQPWAIMSSYNKINGQRASERKDMLTGILREEWGYDGVVMTDWWAFSEQYKEILAGNDIKMACGYPERLLEAMEKGLIAREDLERAATRVLKLILKID